MADKGKKTKSGKPSTGKRDSPCVSPLTDMQRRFIEEYVKDLNQGRAARAAGCSDASADQQASMWLDGVRYPVVARAVRQMLAEKEMRATKKADDILRYIHTAMWFNPLQFFSPSEGGGWLLSQDQYDNLPSDIGCLIEEMRVKVTFTEDGQEVRSYWVKLVSKATAMSLAAKHQLTETIEVMNHNIDWAAMMGRRQRPDPIEALIAGVGQGAVASATVEGQAPALPQLPNALHELPPEPSTNNRGPSTNGTHHEEE